MSSMYFSPDTPIKKQDKEDDDKSKNDNGSNEKKNNDNNNNSSNNKYDSSPSKTVKDNHNSGAKTSDDHDDHKTKSESDASNTVITTIIVIATETPTPTQIYTGTNQSPANQKGESSGSSDSSSSDSNNDNSGDATDPNATSTDANQENKARSNYRKMELALSIVGSVGGTALLAGLFIFTRRQVDKKKKATQKSNDLELGNSPSIPPMATAPSFTGGSSHQGVIVPHNLGNNDSVIIDFENPFSDAAAYKKSSLMQMTDSPITPIAPVHLAPGSYINFRQNQTLSMLSQTTAAVPSAPTAKEIAANENENPFELEATPQYYAQQMNYRQEAPHSHSHSHSVSQHSFENNNNKNNRIENDLTYNMMRATNSNHFNKNHHLSRSISSPAAASRDDLSESPPPAYTPSAIPNAIPNAIPSAPPLYALPNLTRSQQEESRRLSALSSRRHSISSIASTDVRPFPLRRGSGSIAHVSSYYS
ncbi:hypothetical protein K501DRAFT_285045 [Backusella circina FSU 941]|nr:hypothetical protein K501DRAFT_285045 [Backusella circina FSU 941]